MKILLETSFRQPEESSLSLLHLLTNITLCIIYLQIMTRNCHLVDALWCHAEMIKNVVCHDEPGRSLLDQGTSVASLTWNLLEVPVHSLAGL